MAINWKGSILDTYNSNEEFGGGAGPGAAGFKSAKQAGGEKPISTDFIKGVNPQSATLKVTGDAVKGFTPKLTIADKNNTQYNMVVEDKATTKDDFLPLNTNKDYSYGGRNLKGYNKSSRYKKPTNP